MTGAVRSAVRIGCASGFWGDAAAFATAQLLASGAVDYVVYDYLAEITMGVLARQRAADDRRGYATDFVTSAMASNLEAIAAQRVRIVSNAGGLNPRGCAEALRTLIAERGLSLSVAVVEGDDLIEARRALLVDGAVDMATGEAPPPPETVTSLNAYLGAFPIAGALRNGADIVITGRCVDSALTLGPCIAAFGWSASAYDLLAQASLAGHIIECGAQATGGNFTDWREVGEGLHNIGYPIAEIDAEGGVRITIPADACGLVSRATVAEQILYETGDPASYELPDVVCDLRSVELAEEGENCVRVSGARGRPPSQHYKVCATFIEGHRAAIGLSFVGLEAAEKARAYARAVFARTERALKERGWEPFSETRLDLIGVGEQALQPLEAEREALEVVARLSVKHKQQAAAALFIKDVIGLGLATPPGMTLFSPGAPSPSPVMRLFSFLAPKSVVDPGIAVNGEPFRAASVGEARPDLTQRASPSPAPMILRGRTEDIPLLALAWARSGDKGDIANIGVIARRPELLPWIAAALDEERVAAIFTKFQPARVERFHLPGLHALNFVLHGALGGGGASSLRHDPQAKTFAQILLATTLPVPIDALERAQWL